MAPQYNYDTDDVDCLPEDAGCYLPCGGEPMMCPGCEDRGRRSYKDKYDYTEPTGYEWETWTEDEL